jgi:hypothetical protein
MQEPGLRRLRGGARLGLFKNKAGPHYTLHLTIRRTSLYAAPHYTLHLTDMKHAAEQRHRHEPRSRCSLRDR